MTGHRTTAVHRGVLTHVRALLAQHGVADAEVDCRDDFGLWPHLSPMTTPTHLTSRWATWPLP